MLGVLLVWLPTARALQWTGIEAVLRPQADGAMPVASYSFRNATAAPVTITQAVATCDCTLIDLAKKTYAPGESGVLVVRFDPTGRSGTVSRTISVVTDEPGAQPQLLKLTAELPEVLSFTPRDLSWAAGEKPEAKSLDVLVNVREGLELARVPQLERKPEKVSEESGFSAAGGYEGNRVAGGM